MRDSYQFYTAVDGSTHLKHTTPAWDKHSKKWNNGESKYTKLEEPKITPYATSKQNSIEREGYRKDKKIVFNAIKVGIKNLKNYCDKHDIIFEVVGDSLTIRDPNNSKDYMSMTWNEHGYPMNPDSEKKWESRDYEGHVRSLHTIESMQQFAQEIVRVRANTKDPTKQAQYDKMIQRKRTEETVRRTTSNPTYQKYKKQYGSRS